MYSELNDPHLVSPPLPLPAPRPAFQIARNILINFEACEYEVCGRRVPMRYRERQLLLLLVERYLVYPRGYVPAWYLKGRIFDDSDDNLDPDQSIAQIATNIRRKWGEPCRNPCLLKCARDFGYQLRPEPGYGFEVPLLVKKLELNETQTT